MIIQSTFRTPDEGSPHKWWESPEKLAAGTESGRPAGCAPFGLCRHAKPDPPGVLLTNIYRRQATAILPIRPLGDHVASAVFVCPVTHVTIFKSVTSDECA